ncbi:flagellar motor protein MotB [Pseudomonas sp. PAMC 29040]|uniref:OmpA family protein n=1 Tax=Pseudomonas sp. PAMC 29040 TaxID=2498450 RepID=UPI000FB40D3E|nr:OmpA family protein [Pseudomonas sp. PAMC 29040]RUT37619.1 flagellar motor protein MotB [Pseudomonas sp. PAMC 29040]
MTALFEMRIRVGGDPRGFSEFTALRDELARLSHPACPDVDWARVEQLCLLLFHNNGAELQTLAAFTLARSQRYGLEGMAQGVVLLEALCSEWQALWPPMATVRLDLLGWLFAQLQPLLRCQEITPHLLPALERLDTELERLASRLESLGQVPLVTLQGLRHQVGSLLQRLQPSTRSGAILPLSTLVAEPALVMPAVPVVILPARPMPQVPPAARSRVALWLFAAVAITALTGGLWWWSQITAAEAQRQRLPDTVRLDSLSLFDAGSAELKPGSTRVLINALDSIKAQPGWLVMIVGHTDTRGDAEHNLQLSYARAAAVRDWMQRMGDIPDDCFAVQGVAGRQPIAGNDTAPGRAANRRVDIHLVAQAGVCGPSA